MNPYSTFQGLIIGTNDKWHSEIFEFQMNCFNPYFKQQEVMVGFKIQGRKLHVLFYDSKIDLGLPKEKINMQIKVLQSLWEKSKT